MLEAGANAVTGRIRIAWDPARTPLSQLLARLVALGYRPYLATGDARERARRRERNRWLLRLGVAGLGAMQAMMFAEALYLDTHATRCRCRRATSCAGSPSWSSTPVVFYAGWPFLAGAWRELRAPPARHGHAGRRLDAAGLLRQRWSRRCAAARMSGTTRR